MRIAIDCSFEHPALYSSAMDNLRALAHWLPQLAPEHDFLIPVSRTLRPHFAEFECRNLKLVGGMVANDHRLLRIAAQQTLLPWRLRRAGCDVLFAYGNVCPLWSGPPVVLKINTLHHLVADLDIGWARRRYRSVAIAASARRAVRVVANSIYTKTEICRHMGLPQDKVTVIYEAAEDRFGAEVTSAPAPAWTPPRPYLLYPAGLWPYKNQTTLLTAFARLPPAMRAQVDLVLAGRDDAEHAPDPSGEFPTYRARLEHMAAALGIANQVHFPGYLPIAAMPALFHGARMLVFPSLAETFGKPLVEAMRCGCPIVASRATVMPEIVADAGVLVDATDPDQWVAAIRQVWESESLQEQLRDRGRRRARQFSWEAQARASLELLLECGSAGGATAVAS